MPHHSWQIVIAHNAEQLKAHIAVWDDLAAHCIEPNVFYESWHLMAVLHLFGGQKSLFALVFESASKTPLLYGFERYSAAFHD